MMTKLIHGEELKEEILGRVEADMRLLAHWAWSVGLTKRRHRHTWVVATLLMRGTAEGFTAIPEFEVPIGTRSGRGAVDVVWLPRPGAKAHEAIGFEVSLSASPREIAKLSRFKSGYVVTHGFATPKFKKINIKRAQRCQTA